MNSGDLTSTTPSPILPIPANLQKLVKSFIISLLLGKNTQAPSIITKPNYTELAPIKHNLLL